MSDQIAPLESGEPALEDSAANLWGIIPDDPEFAPPRPAVLLTSTTGAARHAFFADGEETMSIQEAISRANLTVNAQTRYMLDGAFVSADTQVGPSATVTLIGPAKGG